MVGRKSVTEDEFDIALETKEDKRAVRDKKYGFGGRKKGAKQNDARSSGDIGPKRKKRLGKSRRK